MRRFLAVLGLILLPATAVAEVDTQNHPLLPFLQSASSKRWIDADADGFFRPTRNITRGEFVQSLVKASYGADFQDEGSSCFTDFTGDERPQWAYICFAKARGVVQGYEDGTFRAGNAVQVAEAVTMAVKAWRIPTPAYVTKPAAWYMPAYDAIARWEGINLLPLSRPADTLSKQHAAVLLEIFNGYAGSSYTPSLQDIEEGRSAPSAPRPGAGNTIVQKAIPAGHYTTDNPPPRRADSQPAPPSAGAAPEISGASAWVNGEPQSMSRLRGNVVLLHFWKPNCPGCDRMLRAMNGLWAQYHESPFAVVTIVVPQMPHGVNVPEFERITRQQEILHPAGDDHQLAVWNAYGAPSFPSFVLMDTSGNIRLQGSGDVSFEDINDNILRLLNDAGAL